MANHDLVVLGDCNPDLLLRGNVVPAFGQVEQVIEEATFAIGGSGAIVATGAARLGLRTALIAVIGDDPLGQLQLQALRERDVDVASVFVDGETSTGISVILSLGEDRAILTALGTIAALSPPAIDLETLRSARHVHVSSYFLQRGLRPAVGALLAEARAAGASTSLDPNWDPAQEWQIDAVLPQLDYLLLNEQEACRIADTTDVEAAARTLAASGPTVAVKLGAQGGLVAWGTQLARRPAVAIDVVDTTGAGDSFDAGFLTGVLAGWELGRALELACACGSLSATTSGVDSQPTLEQAQAAFTRSGP